MANALDPHRSSALLERLRSDLDAPTLSFADGPRWLADGGDAEVYDVALEHAPGGVAPCQVLRVLKPREWQRDAEVERLVVNEIAARGFAAPRSPWASNDPSLFGTPAMLCERLPGRPILGSPREGRGMLEHARCELAGVVDLTSAIAEQAAALHAIDGEAVRDACHVAGGNVAALHLDRMYDRMRERVARCRDPQLDAAFRWLVEARPAAPARLALCHGDLNPGNLLSERRRVTGVIDWSGICLAHPELDVGFVRAGMATFPLLGRLGAAFGTRTAKRLSRAYRRRRALDERTTRYYEAWVMLVLAVQYREVQRGTRSGAGPWDNSRGQRRVASHFRSITGLPLPG